MKKSVRLYINGTVQGVFYRMFIKDNAEKLNVKGFVRNLEDGRIEVFLEGDSERVNQMIELCKKGPRHSQIRDTQIKPERFQDFRTFKVLHI
ncbi:MAG TPA: acylphosphatase [Candidatus Pacearchaeota archaeon]|nr:acylphosphatase [archaeon BMS3Abin17]HDK41833.1 acylphosphatase [Candidatus Pacearchaeota archaeon]HDZ60525.1 acylphosphatase [Candidatus Pacearchaeota archaeon]